MKILVTGSKGFIGRYLCPALESRGHEVVGLDRNSCDVTSHDIFPWWLDNVKPDTVVHLAAHASRLLCEDSPEETVHANVEGTTRVARECGRRGIELVYASSSDVYGNQAGAVCDETAVPNPNNIYAMTKLWGERVAAHYAPGGLLVLRIAMPYGPGHRPHYDVWTPPPRGWSAVSGFLWMALHRRPITVHSGTERSWCWIEDTVDAMQYLVLRRAIGTWNVGRDDNPVSARRVAEIACDLTDAPRDIIQEVPVPPFTTSVKRLSTDKLRSAGWKPSISLEEGMRRTLPWIRSLPGPE